MSGHTPWRELFPYRVVPHTNSWNFAGYTVERWFPLTGVWCWDGRHYWTHWGATRAMREEYRDYCWNRARERGWFD